MLSTNFDLNLIRVFLTIAETQNITTAAKRLGKTPSALSKSLQKLRDETGDQLFVRKSSGLSPTPYAVMLERKLKTVQSDLQMAFANEKFDPKEFQGEIVIAVNAALQDILQPNLMLMLATHAPKATFSFINRQASTYQDLLSEKVQVAIGFWNDICSKEIKQKVIGENTFSLYARNSHPATNLEEALQSPLAILRVNGWNSEYTNFSQHLMRQGIAHRIQYTFEDLNAFLSCIENTDCITPLPYFPKLRGFKHFALNEFECNIKIVACYPSSHRDAMLYQWLVPIIEQAYQQSHALDAS
ncbi:LysR family transcriptional regulator [Vibrio rotiferianus]|uniref:LysR family transcriptional regulator n=1 Tax=Vibrio rotiferianus TaxID=190895 RepID=UPI00390C2A5F